MPECRGYGVTSLDIGVGRFRILGWGARFRILRMGGGKEAKFPADT